MSLVQQWANDPDQLRGKRIAQVIAFAGDGKLRDENATSEEFRELLRRIPSSILAEYADQCLAESFTESGFALQDIVNEMGRRLGLNVTNGRYRGKRGESGHDGLWKLPDGRRVVAEVKTTDAYRIDLNTIGSYAKAVDDRNPVSVLLIVGRNDTGDLEAQVRGSRFAWSMRLISVDALARLMRLKEESVDDPKTLAKIHEILIPREFTRLDDIVDLVFLTVEGATAPISEMSEQEIVNPDLTPDPVKSAAPASFHEECALSAGKQLGQPLVRRSRSLFSSPDERVGVFCAVSKEHQDKPYPNYWFAFHPHQLEALSPFADAWVVFGCGSSRKLILIPLEKFRTWLGGMWTTQRGDHMYWHVVVNEKDDKLTLGRRQGEASISLTKYRL